MPPKAGYVEPQPISLLLTLILILDPADCDADLDSIADGHYAYDSTTQSKLAWSDTTQTHSTVYGQSVKFGTKTPPNSTDQDLDNDGRDDIISYPFPTEPAPDPVILKKAALDSGTYYKASESCPAPPASCNTFYKPGAPGTLLSWNQLGLDSNNVVFIDAQNRNLTFNTNSQVDGIIAAWCGTLRMTNANFHGVLLSMKGDGATLGNDGPAPEGSDGQSTNCVSDDTKGVLTADHSTLKAWLYSNNTSATPGIQLGDQTDVSFVPSGNLDLLGVVLPNPTPPITSIDYKGWRELYE